MSPSKELIDKTMHLLPDLEQLEKQLTEEPEKIISRAFPESAKWESHAIGKLGLESVEFEQLDTAIDEERKRIVEDARSAVHKIRSEGASAELNPNEAFGYEAIISMVGRPALLIQNGRVFPPPPEWEILTEHRLSIEMTCKSVGRIEVPGHPRWDWIGTGFLVADDVVMTNRHVAKVFCHSEAGGNWVFDPDITPRIDFVEELGTPQAAEFEFTEVIGIHERFDLALLKLSSESLQGKDLPDPLILASETLYEMEGRNVYVLGYPAWDPHRNDPEIMRRIFSNVYGVKRLQPGKIMGVNIQDSGFTHDCSTLGGNSGSCVVDLETNQIIGLHYAGRYLEANTAVALWPLKADPLLRKAKVCFD